MTLQRRGPTVQASKFLAVSGNRSGYGRTWRLARPRPIVVRIAADIGQKFARQRASSCGAGDSKSHRFRLQSDQKLAKVRSDSTSGQTPTGSRLDFSRYRPKIRSSVPLATAILVIFNWISIESNRDPANADPLRFNAHLVIVSPPTMINSNDERRRQRVERWW